MKKVFKYATGQPIPEDAIYLTTITEDTIREECFGHCEHLGQEPTPEMRTFTESRLVWHYFLVEVIKDIK